MTFMQSQSHDGSYWEIETRDGTTFLPADVHPSPRVWPKTSEGLPAVASIDLDDLASDHPEDAQELAEHFGPFTEPDTKIQSVVYHPAGTLYRLSAPGYLDCTEWSPDPPQEDDW